MNLKRIIKTFFRDIYVDVFLYLIVLGVSFWFQPKGPLAWFGYLLFTVSVICWVVARIQLGSAFSVLPEAKQLVTKGFYKKIRNPIYLFTELANIGLALVFNNRYLYMALAVHAIVQLIRAKKESQVLSEKFGAQYQDYKNNTWF